MVRKRNWKIKVMVHMIQTLHYWIQTIIESNYSKIDLTFPACLWIMYYISILNYHRSCLSNQNRCSKSLFYHSREIFFGIYWFQKFFLRKKKNRHFYVLNDKTYINPRYVGKHRAGRGWIDLFQNRLYLSKDKIINKLANR